VIAVGTVSGFTAFAKRDLRLALTIVLALFAGYVSQAGLPGSVIAVTIASLVMAVLAGTQFNPRWTRATLVAAAINLVAVAAVAIEPGYLNLAVAWFAVAGLVFVQRSDAPTSLFSLFKAPVFQLVASPLDFLREIRVVRAARNRIRNNARIMTLANFLLPVLAISVFGALLITANPVIEMAVLQISWQDTFTILGSWMPLVSVVTFLLMYAVLTMRPANDSGDPKEFGPWQQNFFRPVPVLITLFALNAMFIAENILDLQYVWSESLLPVGMNHAEYVHRGSYSLIATAILAGALVIFALQPGSRSEASRPIRWLVYLWTAQNIMLVASSAKRTLSYIDAYGMTLWRLSGLIWMGLVAAGLLFIVARIITKRGNLWLLNVNLGAAFIVLLVCGLVDFRGVVADWNVSRAIAKIAEPNPAVDTDYLRQMGPSAIPALNRLMRLSPQGGHLSGTAFNVKGLAQGELSRRQQDWTTWTLRGAWIEAGNTP
jgi:Domain of unknown function (DUF4173)